ncbi:MAG: hypothetical protein APR56_12365 [Methanosaeta sp. SDB]|nr:MAG: hypothetical protein APR56_12365 [Methanosaeta sp. SDB]
MSPEERGPEGRPEVGIETKSAAEPRSWESAEEHRFALEVLQLRVRRDILKFIAGGVFSTEEIAEKFGIDEGQAAFHLAMLDKALVAEPVSGGYRSTPTGLLYLKNVEASYPGKF